MNYTTSVSYILLNEIPTESAFIVQSTELMPKKKNVTDANRGLISKALHSPKRIDIEPQYAMFHTI